MGFAFSLWIILSMPLVHSMTTACVVAHGFPRVCFGLVWLG